VPPPPYRHDESPGLHDSLVCPAACPGLRKHREGHLRLTTGRQHHKFGAVIRATAPASHHAKEFITATITSSSLSEREAASWTRYVVYAEELEPEPEIRSPCVLGSYRAFPSQGSHSAIYIWRLTISQQPTNFWLDVYNTSHVFDTPDLIQKLAIFSEAQQTIERPQRTGSEALEESLLFLHVQAAADFFSTNRTLMNSPPAVDVELILDPYLASAFPRSLLPTAVYIVALAVGSWVLSGMIWKRLFSSTNKPHND